MSLGAEREESAAKGSIGRTVQQLQVCNTPGNKRNRSTRPPPTPGSAGAPRPGRPGR